MPVQENASVAGGAGRQPITSSDSTKIDDRNRNIVVPDSRYYLELAAKLREIARQSRFAGARREILGLACRYDRRADHFNARNAIALANSPPGQVRGERTL
jgi:hypothetical protein